MLVTAHLMPYCVHLLDILGCLMSLYGAHIRGVIISSVNIEVLSDRQALLREYFLSLWSDRKLCISSTVKLPSLCCRTTTTSSIIRQDCKHFFISWVSKLRYTRLLFIAADYSSNFIWWCRLWDSIFCQKVCLMRGLSSVHYAYHEVRTSCHTFYHAILIEWDERVESQSRFRVSKAQLSTWIQAIWEKLSIFIFYHAEVVTHLDLINKSGPWRGNL